MDRQPYLPSIINKGRIPGQNLLSLGIQNIRHLVDLKLMTALLASHPYPPAGARHLKLTFTLFAFHFFSRCLIPHKVQETMPCPRILLAEKAFAPTPEENIYPNNSALVKIALSG